MDSFDIGFIVFVFSCVCAGFTAAVAHNKGFSMLPWIFGGFFFSLIALIAIVGMVSRAEEERNEAALRKKMH